MPSGAGLLVMAYCIASEFFGGFFVYGKRDLFVLMASDEPYFYVICTAVFILGYAIAFLNLRGEDALISNFKLCYSKSFLLKTLSALLFAWLLLEALFYALEPDTFNPFDNTFSFVVIIVIYMFSFSFRITLSESKSHITFSRIGMVTSNIKDVVSVETNDKYLVIKSKDGGVFTIAKSKLNDTSINRLIGYCSQTEFGPDPI